MFKALLLAALALVMSLVTTPAFAYIGPGAGISVLGSLMGILATIFVAIGAILLWPLRKVLRKRRQAKLDGAEGSNDSRTSDTTPVPSDEV